MGSRARLLAVVTSVALAAVLGGCAGSTSGGTVASSTTSASAAPATSSTAAAETTSTTAARLAWGETGTWQGISITITAPLTDSAPESVDPGDKVVYCLVTVVNNSKDAFDYNGLDFMLFDAAHQEYDNFGLTSLPDFGEGTLAPARRSRGPSRMNYRWQRHPAASMEPQTAAGPQLGLGSAVTLVRKPTPPRWACIIRLHDGSQETIEMAAGRLARACRLRRFALRHPRRGILLLSRFRAEA